MSVTPSQTVGPYFSIGLIGDHWTRMATAGDEPRITVRGTVFDADGKFIPDAMLEIWQADRRAFGRFATDPRDGAFAFETIAPRSIRSPDEPAQAPHLCVGVFARGLLKRLYTRIYFADDPLNAADPILALVPPERRATLIAIPTDEARTQFAFDVRLSGQGETVFFDC